MDDIIKMVASKTGISESMAKMAVEIVVAQLKDKLPSGIGSQLDGLLGNDNSSSSENPLSGLTGKLGGLLG